MITRSHALLYFMALLSKWNITENSSFEVKEAFRKCLLKKFPWIFVPDAIRTPVGGRQPSHFEEVPTGPKGNCSWIKFPSEKELKNLKSEVAHEAIYYELKKGYPQCVVGEKTIIGEFDIRNCAHKHYEVLRCHLVQDMCFDEMVRNQLVDCTKRFSNIFTIKHSGKTISGEKLRSQLSILQELGFIKLAGIVYEKTGVLTNRKWFDRYVLNALMEAYPEDMAISTYSFMEISDELDERINSKKFKLSTEEIESVILTNDLERFLDELFAKAMRATKFEL